MDNDKDLLDDIDDFDDLPESNLLSAADDSLGVDGRAWYVIHSLPQRVTNSGRI